MSNGRPYGPSGINVENALTVFVQILAAVFPIVVLTVNRADSVILLLLGLTGIFAFFKFGIRGLALSRQELTLLLVFAGWYGIIVICYFAGDQTDTGFKMLGRSLRIAFLVPAYLACRQYLRDVRYLWAGLIIAPIATLSYALWQLVVAHASIRVSGVVEAIPFGDLSIAMGFLAAAVFYASPRPRSGWLLILTCASLSAGIATSILSQTRGGWLALPLLFAATVVILSENSRKRAVRILAVSGALVVLVLLVSPYAIITDRINDAFGNYSQYREYLNLIEKNDIARQGCINNREFLDNLARQIRQFHVRNLGVSVIDDGKRLDEAGFGSYCQSGYVLKVTDLIDSDNVMFRMQRYVADPGGMQEVRFIARGQGRLTLIYGYDKELNWTTIDSSDYRLVAHRELIKSLAWPDFWVPAGHSLYLVPVQAFAGEYAFPFVNNSVGQRLEMWRAAWHIFREYPVLGAGTGSFLDQVDRRIREGEVFLSVISYDHPHNDLLNAMYGQGALGLLAYLLALGYPLAIFAGALRNENRQSRAAGFAGVIVVCGLFVFGLTETMFIHSIVISWYVIFVSLLAAAVFRYNGIKAERRDEAA